MRKKIVAGNWKMNTSISEGERLSAEIVEKSKDVDGVLLIVAPPFTHLTKVADKLRGSRTALSAQNCAAETSGAYTGEVAASMIAETGAAYCILGHSERREYYGETDETLNKKLRQCFAGNLSPIFCVGEKLAEREGNRHFEVIKTQLQNTVFNLEEEDFGKVIIAYEPVWAIGTGKTATPEQAQEIHAFIRKTLAEKFGAKACETSILYGGSCNPANAKSLFANGDVDGGLIGGASLKSDDFIAIAKSF
ncbi:MAG: triose-phosphate isomerase [Prevotellaceae bacterium]|jgi:triosephosphate isomerase|nr:triose-phosphate isomerase [Prevotellaceae bacterium]